MGKYALIFLFISTNLFSQSKFSKLSAPEKRWVLFHPFVAKKAFKITQRVLFEVDSLKNAGAIGRDNNGGKLDAFKHAYWMNCLGLAIGKKKALKLGMAHEKGNYIQWKRKFLEDSILPDSVSSEMDKQNNEIGIRLSEKCKHIHFKGEIAYIVMEALQTGKLVVIKKDVSGNYLTCEGAVVNMSEWKGKWNIPKCLVPSSFD
ncbi:MAG: hypothetical protein J0L87_00700 [Bacteroidetes bacterium]|nr:hypothetical protein [Bacteroidota bacterium]